MLVLTRRVRQSIMIGDQVEVSVLAVMGDKVRLGIEAPADVPVYRTEIYLEIREHGSRREQRAGEDLGRGAPGLQEPS